MLSNQILRMGSVFNDFFSNNVFMKIKIKINWHKTLKLLSRRCGRKKSRSKVLSQSQNQCVQVLRTKKKTA